MQPKTIEELQAENETLRAKIARASADADADDPGDRGSIPAARFAYHRQQLRDLQGLADGIKEQIGKTAGDIKISSDSTVKKLRDEHVAALTLAERRAAHDLGLSDAGIKDSTIRRLVREHIEAMDEKDRPESPAAWIEARREAAAKAKADTKATAPAALPWLDAYEAHVSASSASSARRPPPNLDAGAGPAGGDGLTMDDVGSMSPAQLAKYAGLPEPKTRA